MLVVFQNYQCKTTIKRPVTSIGHFQVATSLDLFKSIDMKMIFYSHANKGFSLSLILNVRVFETWKWPIFIQNAPV